MKTIPIEEREAGFEIGRGDYEICQVKGCTSKKMGRNLCNKHYKRWQRGQPLEDNFKSSDYQYKEKPKYLKGFEPVIVNGIQYRHMGEAATALGYKDVSSLRKRLKKYPDIPVKHRSQAGGNNVVSLHINGIFYPSIMSACEAFGIARTTMKREIKKHGRDLKMIAKVKIVYTFNSVKHSTNVDAKLKEKNDD